MEDQPTDTSDLTDTGDAESDTAAPRGGVPVGKRRGRHRYFRPRPVAAAADEPTDEVDATQQDEAPEAETVEAEGPAVEPADAEPAEEPAEESAPKAKRRRLFGRRPAKPTEAELPDEEPVAVAERKPVSRRMVIAVAVAAALFVAAGAFGGAMLQPYLADRTVADTKLDIARTATGAITTLFTYTPEDMDQLAARSAKYLGGDLKDEYAKQVDALAATNKQNQIHRSAQVVGAAVESLDGPKATAVVYANVTYTSATTKDVPRIYLVSYRLTMQRTGSDWVITNMPWITSKDLTRITP